MNPALQASSVSNKKKYGCGAIAVIILLILVAVAFAAGRKSAQPPAPPPSATTVEPAPSVRLPSPEMQKKLARAALRDAGLPNEKPGPITINRQLPDGSYLITLMLASGRTVSGRLYSDRWKWHIAVDRQELFSHKSTITIKEER